MHNPSRRRSQQNTLNESARSKHLYKMQSKSQAPQYQRSTISSPPTESQPTSHQHRKTQPRTQPATQLQLAPSILPSTLIPSFTLPFKPFFPFQHHPHSLDYPHTHPTPTSITPLPPSLSNLLSPLSLSPSSSSSSSPPPQFSLKTSIKKEEKRKEKKRIRTIHHKKGL